MKLRDFLLMERSVFESINDAGIFKAIFVIGIPGAGKSYTVSQMTGNIPAAIVNTDKSVEFLVKKMGIVSNEETWPHFKDTAHRMTKTTLVHALNGMRPLFIDGTSSDPSAILRRAGLLESIGYDIGLVHVGCSLSTAKAAAAERAKKIGREVDEKFIELVDKHDRENTEFLSAKFSNFFVDIKNDRDELTNEIMNKAFTKAETFFNSPVVNPIGKRAIKKMKDSGSAYLAPEIFSTEYLAKIADGWYKS